MNPHAAALRQKHQKATHMLFKGYSPEAVSSEVGLSVRAIYNLARRENLPTNPSVQPGGKIEGQIVYMHCAGYETAVIGRRFRLAVSRVQDVIARARDRVRESCLDNPG